MRYVHARMVVVALFLASCQGPVPTAGRPGAAPSKAPSTVAKASAGTSVSPVASPAPAQLLKAPADGSVALAGTVAIDAAYAAAHGHASIIARASSRVVALDGAHLISQDGGGVVSNDGGSVVSNDGGSVVSNDGGSLVNAAGNIVAQGGGNVIVPAAALDNDGSKLVGQDGSSLIGQDGGGLISQDGGGLLSQDGAGYRLAATDGPTAGERLPAAGMLVSVVDPRTGLTVPLGVDAAGKQVRAVYTDASGGFHVYLPKALASNVRIVARAPNSGDSRLALHVIAPVGADAPPALDEAADATTAYIRYLLATKLLLLVKQDGNAVKDFIQKETSSPSSSIYAGPSASSANPSAQQLLLESMAEPFGRLHDALVAAGVPGMSGRQQLDVCLLGADRILAELNLKAITVDFNFSSERHDAALAAKGKPAVEVFRTALDELATAAANHGAGAPGGVEAFAQKPYLIAANLQVPPDEAFTITKPSDLASFVVKAYLAANDHRQVDLLEHVYTDLDGPPDSFERLSAASSTLFEQVLAQLLTGSTADGQSCVEAMIATIKQAAPSLAAAPAPPPGASPPAVPAYVPPSPEPAGQVTTVAGSQPGRHDVGHADGVGAAVRFVDPKDIALDPHATPTTFYIADPFDHAIRRLRWENRQATVDTVAQDAKTLLDPERIAVAADGSLYVSDGAARAILHVLTGQTPMRIETLAGDNGNGFADGPGAQAKFARPLGLAIDPNGNLVVADTDNHRIRRIALADPQHTVSTLMGNGTSGEDDEAHAADALVDTPAAVAYGPDGTLYIAEASNHLRAVAPGDGKTRLLAGGTLSGGVPDGFWCRAGFSLPQGVAIDGRGRAIVTDASNRIRLVTPDDYVMTIAGLTTGVQLDGKPTNAFVDGAANDARFAAPVGLAIAPDGTIWIADSLNAAIRRLVPAGVAP